MDKFKFYDIDCAYIDYLKMFEPKIPNMSYCTNNKFVCGIVLKVNNLNYFAPISSFKEKQQTNFIIMDDKNNAVSSIRFSFMFPAPFEVLTIKDFKKEEYHYKRLLLTELKFCNDNNDSIFKKATQVYKIGTNEKHPLFKQCCNFKLLEQKCLEYILQQTFEESAESKET